MAQPADTAMWAFRNLRVPDDEWTRELRLAPVMTGGTSLAVWMGGVTAELYRMIYAGNNDPTDPLGAAYATIMQLTRTRPLVDVITGTSAGGLNGSLLAAAWKLNIVPAAFDGLRDLWLRAGELAHLLRNANEANPPSLLYGDDRFSVEVEGVLNRWLQVALDDASYSAPGVAERDTDLMLTMTTIGGESETAVDSFGQRIGELRYTATFRFQNRDLPRSENNAQRPGKGKALRPDPEAPWNSWIAQLATASRTSASLPFVFESSHIDVRDPEDLEEKEVAALKKSGRPNFHKIANLQKSHWAMDGGVVINMPLGEAIDRIFAQPAGGELRRVVLYIKPTPTLPTQPDHALLTEPPSIVKAASSAFTAIRAEGVLKDIRAIDMHNREVRRAQEARAVRVIAPGGDGDKDLQELAADLFSYYRNMRALRSVSSMMDSVRSLDPEIRLADQSNIEKELRRRRLDSLAIHPGEFGIGADQPWAWGIASLEHSCAVLLNLINALFEVRARGPIGSTAKVRPLAPSEDNGETTVSIEINNARRVLSVERSRVYDVVLALEAIRKVDGSYWSRKNGERRVLARSDRVDQALSDWAQESYQTWPTLSKSPKPSAEQKKAWYDYQAALRDYKIAMRTIDTGAGSTPEPVVTEDELTIGQSEMLADLLRLGHRLGEVIWKLRLPWHWLRHADMSPEEGLRGEPRQEAYAVLEKLLGEVCSDTSDYPNGRTRLSFAGGEHSDEEPLSDDAGSKETSEQEAKDTTSPGIEADPEQSAYLLRNLLALHVVDTMSHGSRTDNEQLLELMQISWDSDDLLTGRSPADKLAGPEMGRLGAFVKPSWRSNDWFWGRMDGANRTAMLLLDPKRLYQLDLPADLVRAAIYKSVALANTVYPEEPETAVNTKFALTPSEQTTWDQIRDAYGYDRQHDPDNGLTTREVIQQELAFLDNDGPIPDRLDECVRLLTFGLQLAVAADELPKIYSSITRSLDDGGVEGDPSFRLDYERLVAAGKNPATRGSCDAKDLVELLRSMRIGQETAADEVKGDLLMRTLTQASTVTIKALSGTSSGGSALARAFRPLRIPVSVAQAFVSNATDRSRVAQAITMFVLILSGAMIALSTSGTSVPSGVGSAAVIIFVISLGASALRANLASALPLLALLGLAGLAIVGDQTADLVYECGKLAENEVCKQAPTWKTLGFTNSWSLARGFLAFLFSVGAVAWLTDLSDLLKSRGRPDKARTGGLVRNYSDDELAAQDRMWRKLAWRAAALVTSASFVLINFQWLAGLVMNGSYDPEDVGNIRGRLARGTEWLHAQRAWMVVVLFVFAGWVISWVWDKSRHPSNWLRGKSRYYARTYK